MQLYTTTIVNFLRATPCKTYASMAEIEMSRSLVCITLASMCVLDWSIELI